MPYNSFFVLLLLVTLLLNGWDLHNSTIYCNCQSSRYRQVPS